MEGESGREDKAAGMYRKVRKLILFFYFCYCYLRTPRQGPPLGRFLGYQQRLNHQNACRSMRKRIHFSRHAYPHTTSPQLPQGRYQLELAQAQIWIRLSSWRELLVQLSLPYHSSLIRYHLKTLYLCNWMRHPQCLFSNLLFPPLRDHQHGLDSRLLGIILTKMYNHASWGSMLEPAHFTTSTAMLYKIEWIHLLFQIVHHYQQCFLPVKFTTMLFLRPQTMKSSITTSQFTCLGFWSTTCLSFMTNSKEPLSSTFSTHTVRKCQRSLLL